MKKQSKKSASPRAAVNTTHCSSPAQYAMRTECYVDSVLIRATLGHWVTMWRDDNVVYIKEDGTSWTMPDMHVAFSLSPSAPKLNVLRWLIDSLTDCHVAAQSLMPAAGYTGERMEYDKLDLLKERPTVAVFEEALKGVRGTKACLRNTFQYMDAATKRFDAELGDIEPHLVSQAKLMASLCKRGLAPKEWAQDETKLAAMGRYLAETVWAQSRPEAFT